MREKFNKEKTKIIALVQDWFRNKNSMLIMFIVLVLLCFITYIVPFEFDFTRNKANSISQEGKRIVKDLEFYILLKISGNMLILLLYLLQTCKY